MKHTFLPIFLRVPAFLACLPNVLPSICFAQVYEKVYSFSDARAEDLSNGSLPQAALVEDSDGSFYGTTEIGGAFGEGTVFRLTPGGVLKTLVEFTGNITTRGARPGSPLVKGRDGNFYGTTFAGGTSGNGTVFKVTRFGVLTTIVNFANSGVNRGLCPRDLVLGSDGNFYGTTYGLSGSGTQLNNGTVFKMTPAGELSTVEFTGIGGRWPEAGLVESDDGSFYGTTEHGGASGHGTIFRMTPALVLETLVHFTGNNSIKGSRPVAGLVQAADEYFYGTTQFGGASNQGTIFRMTRSGVLTTLVEFTGNGAINKGANPVAGLVPDSNGNLYGTTRSGGAAGFGTVFRMTPSGGLTTLVEFTANGSANKGSSPFAELMLGSDGNFYGTTLIGGSFGRGTVFKMTPDGVLTTLVEFGVSATGTVPVARLAQPGDGNFYGTTRHGGAFGEAGTVFKLTAGGALTTLADFKLSDTEGGMPASALVHGSDEALYGTTTRGATGYDPANSVYGYGTVFKVTPAGEFTTLVKFSGNGMPNKGGGFKAGLVRNNPGNFYGTTSGILDYGSGFLNQGTVFMMTPDGVLTTLVEFTGTGGPHKGSAPLATLTLDSEGNFYGTTSTGGVNNLGTVYKMTPGGALTTLVEFSGNAPANKGSNPRADLITDIDGNFYGTTTRGGAFDSGTVFKMTGDGVLTTLVEFSGNGPGNKGSSPEAGLIQGNDGNFYGTTRFGGASNFGTVFKMTPDGVLTTLVEFPNSEDGEPTAALIPGTDGNLYGTTKGPESLARGGTVYRLVFPGAPNVFLLDPREIGTTSAVASARVNPRGLATSVWVESGSDGVAFPNTAQVGSNLTGFQSKLVGTTLDNLSPGTLYHYRIRATSSAGTTLSPVVNFATLAPPVVATGAAAELAAMSARFNGLVNARNYPAVAHFEWGTDGNSFPHSVPAIPGTVSGSSDVSVSAPVAGLTKGTTYFYRIVATNAGGTAVSGASSFITLTEPVAGVTGATALSTARARVDGWVNARGSHTTVVVDYGTDGINFNSATAVPATVNGTDDTPVSAELRNLTQGTTYHYRVKAVSDGGTGTSAVRTFSLSVLSGLIQTFPDPPPPAEGVVTVILSPPGIGAGWRFNGEQQWRSPGVAAGALATGDRLIEFRPVPGHLQPPPETVSVVSGEGAVIIQRDYYTTPSTGAGGLIVILKPDSLASARWRLAGEDETQWRNSEVTLAGLAPGTYLVECKPVAGRTTPPPSAVSVMDGLPEVCTLTYFLADAQTGAPPDVLSFDTVSRNEEMPYAYVGQLRSNAGSGSGFVVKRRVVATAAHLVFDDGTLSAVTGLQWLFQRDPSTFEPKPQTPRGFYISSGYAAARDPAISPGVVPGEGTAQSQDLDFAALYFLEEAGRGGVGGFLASEALENEFLISASQKILVGYPVDSIEATNQGRMHATPPANVVFSHASGRTYTTSDIRSSGGNSGGPLCVQHQNGKYFPAAIYLGGSAQTVVRAIDNAVVDLFNRAEVSGNGGANNTGGGITHTGVTGNLSATQPGAIKVLIEPAGARAAGAGWRLSPETNYRPHNAQLGSRTHGIYILQLKPVAGFHVPADQQVTITGGQLLTVTFTYAQTPLESWRFAHFGTTESTGNAADGADPDSDGRSNLDEYAALTDPNTGASAFHATAITDSAGLHIRFTAKAGRSYRLEASDTLAGAWQTLYTRAVAGSDAEVDWLVSQVQWRRFYRTVAEAP